MVNFPNPSAAVLGGHDFSTQATDIGSFDINPNQPSAHPSISVPEVLGGPGGFNLPGLGGQNIMTDMNVGLSGGGGPSFGGAGLSNPMLAHGFPNMDAGLDGSC